MTSTVQDQAGEYGYRTGRNQPQSDFGVCAWRKASNAAGPADQGNDADKSQDDIGGQTPGSETAHQRRECGHCAADGKQVDQGPQHLRLRRTSAAAGQEPTQVARIGQELVEELAAQQEILGAEPGHEEGGDQAEAAHQRQHAGERQARHATPGGWAH